MVLIICLFLIVCCFAAIRYLNFKLDSYETIANIRIEPSESDFRKLFEADSSTFQQFVHDSEDCRRRSIRRRIRALRVVIVLLCVVSAFTLLGCTTTRNLSNTYNVTLDTLNYKFNFEHSENVSTKRD